MVALVLILDENMPKRLRTELNNRNRQTYRTLELGAGGTDPQVIKHLTTHLNYDWILVTADDAMPREHRPLLASYGVTVATIAVTPAPTYSIDQWRRDVVHRWAHVMQAQSSGSIKRYWFHRHTAWR